MAKVTHAFVSAKSDGSDATQVQPSNWNADHVITGLTDITASDYNFTAQTPGVNLTAGITNSITLTPVPAGVNGTDLYHYLYISNGVGSAEAVIITGGTAVSGAASGTITFVPANNHSGAWTIQSATSGIQEAILASSSGQTIRISPGSWPIYGTLAIGNGDCTNAGYSVLSTYQGLRLLGSGTNTDFVHTCATELIWNGAAGGTMIKYHGPVSGVELAYMRINGNGRAGDIIQSNWGDQGFMHDLLIGNSQAGTYFGLKLDYGCGGNVVQNVFVVMLNSGNSCVGLGYNPTLQGVSQNTLIHVKGAFAGDTATSYGLALGACDNNSFIQCDFQGSSSYVAITNATNATPIVLTFDRAVPGLATGQTISVFSVKGNTAANSTAANQRWTITKISTTQCSLNGSVGNGAWTSGGAIVGPGFALSMVTNGNEPFENSFVNSTFFGGLFYDDDAGHGANFFSGVPTGDGMLLPTSANNLHGLFGPDYYIQFDGFTNGVSRFVGRLKFVDSNGILGYAKFYPDYRAVVFGDSLEGYHAPGQDVTIIRNNNDAVFNILTAGASGSAVIKFQTPNGHLYQISSDQVNNYFKINNPTGDVMAIVYNSLDPTFFGNIQIGGAAGPKIRSGTGSPEAAVTGNPGDLYLNKSGGASTTLYVKESGTGNTGWIAK